MTVKETPRDTFRENLVRQYNEFALIARDPVLLIGLLVAAIFIAIFIFLPIGQSRLAGFSRPGGKFQCGVFRSLC